MNDIYNIYYMFDKYKLQTTKNTLWFNNFYFVVVSWGARCCYGWEYVLVCAERGWMYRCNLTCCRCGMDGIIVMSS